MTSTWRTTIPEREADLTYWHDRYLTVRHHMTVRERCTVQWGMTCTRTGIAAMRALRKISP